MHYSIKGALLGLVSCVSAFAADLATTTPAPQPWATSAFNVETGVLWEIGTGTPIAYRLVPTQFSWRSPAPLTWQFSDGSWIVFRNRLTLIGTWVQNGPESHYAGFSGSPSIEWWDKSGKWSLFTGSGGGFGWIDSRGVKGGEGEDFTLNWFIRGGFEIVTAKDRRFSAGIMYQHMSNGGRTKPNPGIDALGFTFGYSWRF